MKILFIFYFIIASPVHADINKCLLANGKTAYQAAPCNPGEDLNDVKGKSSVGQNAIKTNKLNDEDFFNGIMRGDDAITAIYVEKLKILEYTYEAYAREFSNEAQPFTNGLVGDGIKVINDASKGLSITDTHNPTYIYRLKSIHDEMKQKGIPSLVAYYDYKEKAARNKKVDGIEWTRISERDDSSSYVNLATIRKDGNLVKMWEILDFKTSKQYGEDRFLSRKSQEEYDCLEVKSRSLIYLEYSDNMGKGKLVWSLLGDGQWSPVVPGSIGETFWKVACGILKP